MKLPLPPCSFIYVNILDGKTSSRAHSFIFNLSLLGVTVFQGLKDPEQWSLKPWTEPFFLIGRDGTEGIMESGQINICYLKHSLSR